MRILAIVQSIFAIVFVLFGLVTLFGIGITGLLFLIPGFVFAATAGIVANESRGAAGVALAVDAVLAYMAVNKLTEVIAFRTTDSTIGMFDYLFPVVALLLVGIGAVAVLMDWRTLRNAPWL